MYQIQHMRVRHLQIVEYMLSNPDATYEQIGKIFNVSVPWISVIYRSQLFQAKLRERLAEHEVLTDITVLDQINGVASLALDKLGKQVEKSIDPDFLLDATDKLLRRAGYGTAQAGAKVTVNNNVQQNNVIAVDAKTLAECRAMMLTQGDVGASRNVATLPGEARRETEREAVSVVAGGAG